MSGKPNYCIPGRSHTHRHSSGRLVGGECKNEFITMCNLIYHCMPSVRPFVVIQRRPATGSFHPGNVWDGYRYHPQVGMHPRVDSVLHRGVFSCFNLYFLPLYPMHHTMECSCPTTKSQSVKLGGELELPVPGGSDRLVRDYVRWICWQWFFFFFFLSINQIWLLM